MNKTVSTREQGSCFEQQARCFLERKGLRFIAANQYVSGGELDLIMQDQTTLVFVEVRQRKDNHFGSALESIGYTKQKRLFQSANLWLAQKGFSLETADCRFDAVVFEGKDKQLMWYPNFMELNQ